MDIAIIGVPLDLGAGRRGVDMGPSAIRAANLHESLRSLGHRVRDAGNVQTVENESRTVREPRLKFVDEIVGVCENVSKVVADAVGRGETPVIRGGDHSVAIGTWAGLAAAGRNEGLIWIDAHGDFNTAETSPSGNVHGMPFSALLGLGDERLVRLGGVAPKANGRHCALVGVRELDPAERLLLERSGIRYFTMREIDERGIRAAMSDAIKLAGKGRRRIHVSFDIDAVDPAYAQGTGTPSPGGLSLREAHLAMEMVADTGQLQSLEMVEVNPLLDNCNSTGELAANLVASALGKRII